MFDLPRLRGLPRKRESVQVFRGLDRRVRAAAGSCCEMEGFSPSEAACLAVRQGRERVLDCEAPSDLCAVGGGLAVIDGTKLLFNGTQRGTVSAGRHQLAAMGGRLVIFPDKKMFDTNSLTLSDMEMRWSGAVRFTANSMSGTGLGGFRPGDGVTVSGCKANPGNNKTVVVREVDGDRLVFSEECFSSGYESAAAVVREVPDLKFVCERDNRLWGVHGSTICCSVLGDPCNWNVFEGLATDGFSVETATEGAFTGCGVFGSHLLFFKEQCVHKVYGVKPSQFQVQVSPIPGVMAGCERSVCSARGALYWWSREGLVAYGGGVPETVSQPLGDMPYESAAAGASGGVLHLSGLRGGAAEHVSLSLDSGAWCREDGHRAAAFATPADGLFWLGEDGVYRAGGGEVVQWSAHFAGFGEDGLAARTPTRLEILGDFADGTRVDAAVSCDGGAFHTVFSRRVHGAKRLRIPAALQRGREVQVRVSGEGGAVLRALHLIYLEGEE